MKKFIKKALTILLAGIIATSLVGCGGGDSGRGVSEKVDPKRTQLYIGNYNGGYGDSWLKAVKKRFEEFYKETEFEPGTDKKGVQVLIDNKKEEYKSIVNLSSTINESKNSIYFVEDISYDDLCREGFVADITEALTSPLSEYGENKSILDKFSTQQKDYYKKNNKYYAIPNYSAYFGIVYDVDLFEDNLLYFSANTDNGNDGFIKNLSETRSQGPDNQQGTYDDGLPATYDDFYKLCERMDDSNIIPFIWSGYYSSSYMRQFASAFLVDYEGYDDAILNFTFDGTDDEIVTGFSNGNPVLATKTITPETGYEVFSQLGKYYSIKFIKTIVANGWYDKTNSFNINESHTLAQEDYLYSKYEGKPIGMLADGIWWETEASETFEDVAKSYDNAGRGQRRFGFMPYPKATSAQVGEQVTLYDQLCSIGFVNSKATGVQKDLAIKFLRFANTDVSLREFHTKTNTPKSLEYTLTSEDENKLTHFGKMVNTIKNSAQTVYAYADNDFFRYAHITLLDSYKSLIGGLPYVDIAKTFKDHKNYTAEQYFSGIGLNYSRSYWEDTYGF